MVSKFLIVILAFAPSANSGKKSPIGSSTLFIFFSSMAIPTKIPTILFAIEKEFVIEFSPKPSQYSSYFTESFLRTRNATVL